MNASLLFQWIPSLNSENGDGQNLHSCSQPIIQLKECEVDMPRYMQWKAWLEREQVKAERWRKHYHAKYE